MLQGWVDLANVTWDAGKQCLSGVARVIGGEPFEIVAAGNGSTATRATASGGRVKLIKNRADGLVDIILERPDNGEVYWKINY